MTHSSTRHEGQLARSSERGTSTLPDGDPPLLDPAVFGQFKDELEDDAFTRIFVESFIDFLPRRIERLRLALTTGDLDGAVDAVLSLKTSSQMVGADRLAGLAAALEDGIRSDATALDPAAELPRTAAAFLAPIKDCGTLTCHSLLAHCRAPDA